jgi:hypothetical protein
VTTGASQTSDIDDVVAVVDLIPGTAENRVDTATAGLLRTLSPAALSAVIWKR